MPPGARGLGADGLFAQGFEARQDGVIASAQVVLGQQDALVAQVPVAVGGALLNGLRQGVHLQAHGGQVGIVAGRQEEQPRQAAREPVALRTGGTELVGAVLLLAGDDEACVGADDGGGFFAVRGPRVGVGPERRQLKCELVLLAAAQVFELEQPVVGLGQPDGVAQGDPRIEYTADVETARHGDDVACLECGAIGGRTGQDAGDGDLVTAFDGGQNSGWPEGELRVAAFEVELLRAGGQAGEQQQRG